MVKTYNAFDPFTKHCLPSLKKNEWKHPGLPVHMLQRISLVIWKPSPVSCLENTRLAGVDVEAHSQNENGEGNKEEEGVDEHSFPIGLEASELDVVGVTGHLKDEPRRQ